MTLAFLSIASEFVSSLALALIIAVTVSPLMHALSRRGVPDWLSYTITLVLLAELVLILAGMTAAGVMRLAGSMPQYTAQLEQTEEAAVAMLEDRGILPDDITRLMGMVDPARIAEAAVDVALGLMRGVSSIVLLLLTSAFLLVEGFGFPKKAARQIELGNDRVESWLRFATRLREYMYLTMRLGALAAVLDTILLLAIGVEFALLWGVLSFILSFIPTLGFWLALVPPALLALLQFGWPQALAVVIGYGVINTLVDNVLRPRIMGRGLDLAPSVVFLAVLFWGLVLGPLGAILAVPMTMAVKELLLWPDENTRWIADLMAAGPVPTPKEEEGEAAHQAGAAAEQSEPERADDSRVSPGEEERAAASDEEDVG